MTAEWDPELTAMLDAELAAPISAPIDDSELLAQVDQALAAIEPMADAGWEQAQSIARQLRWCRGTLRGDDVEPPPGPFSMGLIATREFDMYGSQPELAVLVNRIEDAMQRRGHLR